MLHSEVLILNRVYLPVRVTTVRRAVCLLYQGKARAILRDYSTYDFGRWMRQPVDDRAEAIGLAHGRLRIPRVIVLESYSGVPRHEVRFTRRNVFARDGHRCQYCGTVRSSKDLNLDHVTPVSQGGSSTWENVVCCCIGCNRRKGDRSVEAAGMRLLRPPKRPRWHPLHDGGRRTRYPEDWRHFVDTAILEWTPDGSRLSDRTSGATG
jgi:5-methylcytosine-specific restriction endonuclease McrA